MEGVLHKYVLEEFKVGAFKYVKDAWRYKLVEAPAYCSDDTPQEECTMVCNFDPADEDASAYAWKRQQWFEDCFARELSAEERGKRFGERVGDFVEDGEGAMVD